MKGTDQLLIPGHQAVVDRQTHQFPGSAQFLRCKIGTVRLEIAEDLIKNLIGPPGLKNAGAGEPDKNVPEHAGVEHVGVVDDGEPAHS